MVTPSILQTCEISEDSKNSEEREAKSFFKLETITEECDLVELKF